MSARHKLNSASFNGCLLIAGGVAFLAESWGAFWITLGLLTFSAVATGAIRVKRR